MIYNGFSAPRTLLKEQRATRRIKFIQRKITLNKVIVSNYINEKI